MNKKQNRNAHDVLRASTLQSKSQDASVKSSRGTKGEKYQWLHRPLIQSCARVFELQCEGMQQWAYESPSRVMNPALAAFMVMSNHKPQL